MSINEYELPEPFQRMEFLEGRETRFNLFDRSGSDAKLMVRDGISEIVMVYPKERRVQALDRTALLAGSSDTAEELSSSGIGSASKAFKFSSSNGKVTYVIAFIIKGYNVVLTADGKFLDYSAILDLAKKALNKIEVYSSLR
jgi:hypothetical protein